VLNLAPASARVDWSQWACLDVLKLLRPHLSADAVIAADMSYGDTDHDAYRAHVTDPGNGMLSSEIALDAGLVISTPATE
jgi:hypothetical protein